jgi:hypothetical protein
MLMTDTGAGSAWESEATEEEEEGAYAGPGKVATLITLLKVPLSTSAS